MPSDVVIDVVLDVSVRVGRGLDVNVDELCSCSVSVLVMYM